MKNFLSFLICINLLIAPALAVMTDSFTDKSLDKSLKIKDFQQKNISDEFAERTLDKNMQIAKYNPVQFYINDDCPNLNTNIKSTIYKPVSITDNFLPIINDEKKKKVVAIDYSNSVNVIPVVIKIKNNLTTKIQPEEGSYLEFETVSDVKIKNIFYPKGTTVKGRIETVSMNKSLGVPSDLVIGNFEMEKISLQGELKKVGANRSLWVYPCAYGGTIFFGLGLLLLPIRGGHAKVLTSETFTVYAENL